MRIELDLTRHSLSGLCIALELRAARKNVSVSTKFLEFCRNYQLLPTFRRTGCNALTRRQAKSQTRRRPQ